MSCSVIHWHTVVIMEKAVYFIIVWVINLHISGWASDGSDLCWSSAAEFHTETDFIWAVLPGAEWQTPPRLLSGLKKRRGWPLEINSALFAAVVWVLPAAPRCASVLVAPVVIEPVKRWWRAESFSVPLENEIKYLRALETTGAAAPAAKH